MDDLSHANAIYADLKNSTQLGHVIRALGIIEWKKGRLPRAMELAATATQTLSLVGNADATAWALQLGALVELHGGRSLRARTQLESVLEVAPNSPFSRPSLLTTEFLGDVHLEQEQAEPALKLYDEVLPKAMALVPKGDIVAELRRRRAECFLLLGRFDEAYAEARTGLEHCRELGDRYEEAATYRILALSAAALGRPSEAKELFEQGFSYYEDIETPYEWGKLWMSYGDWLRGPNAGEFADARGALEAYVVAREHFERMGAAGRLAMVNARFAELSVALSAGDPPPSGPPPAASAPIPRRPSRRRDAQRDQRAAWAREYFGMITRHRPLLDLLDRVDRLAKSKAPILILGESGTGKELVARGIHRLSGRSGAYLPINCSAIGRDMIESELFGHLAGSFTGAQRDKPGLFEVCDSGTAFLDEIGELNLDLQSKLLRFLETGETRRVGATKNLAVDVRIVAATNRERQAMERGSGFRSDLYYRLAHGVVELPPLRQRGDDVELLVEHFLAQACERERRTVSLSDAAMQRLARFPWPGNVRQLRAVVEHAVIVANEGEEVGPTALMLEDEVEPSTFETEMELVEKRRIEEALAQHGGSKAHAARSLRLPRTTLIAKMKRHGLMP
jgi:DNA-binding NtrC family response regulator